MTAARSRQHWESIYRTKGEDELSWHQDTPELSLRLIQQVAGTASRIVDIGGGTSPLAARLVENGFRSVAVLDIADSAIRANRLRSGGVTSRVRWIRADVTEADSIGRFDVWHDRAVFHFLTEPRDRAAYLGLARRSLPVGGHAILATFALDGPETCSDLDVARYDGRTLGDEFSGGFTLVREIREVHTTPWGALQPFTYVVLRRTRGRSATSKGDRYQRTGSARGRRGRPRAGLPTAPRTLPGRASTRPRQ